MIALSHFVAKFVAGKDHRVDVAHQTLLCGSQGGNRFGKTHLSDHHDINVTLPIRGALGQRAEQERRLDPLFKIRKSALQDADRPHGFQD